MTSHYVFEPEFCNPAAGWEKGQVEKNVRDSRHRLWQVTEMPTAFRTLQDLMLRKPEGDREMVDILSLVLQHDEQMVLRAVEMALEAGVPTKTHILNLLHRLVDRKVTDHPEVDPPEALSLQNAPQANVDRYDGLRDREDERHAS